MESVDRSGWIYPVFVKASPMGDGQQAIDLPVETWDQVHEAIDGVYSACSSADHSASDRYDAIVVWCVVCRRGDGGVEVASEAMSGGIWDACCEDAGRLMLYCRAFESVQVPGVRYAP